MSLKILKTVLIPVIFCLVLLSIKSEIYYYNYYV